MLEKMLQQFDLSPLVAVVDIETLSTGINAKILSVGCVLVDVLDGRSVAEFYQRVEMDTQLQRDSDQDTIRWWSEQNKRNNAAFREVFCSDLHRLPLKTVLLEFERFLSLHFGQTKRQVMGNGPEFDNAILAHAYQQCGLSPAWHYAGNQSLRTVVWMGRVLLGVDPKYGENAGIKHHALDDARHEARYLLDIMQALQAKCND